MGKLLALLLVLGLAGGGIAVYNVYRYELVQPLPVGWTHSEDEQRLLELERQRRELVAREGAGQRVTSLAGMPQAPAGDDVKAALAALDREIAALRARVGQASR